jgi:release factor glutamine methyltransferase
VSTQPSPAETPGSSTEAGVAVTVQEAQIEAAAHQIARLDASLMLAAITRQPQGTDARSWAITHGTQRLTPAERHHWATWLKRRASGEPLAYLLGSKEFFGLDLTVNPAVLVPRPDTEILIEWALELIPLTAELTQPRSSKVMDLGTGSGAIALALKHQRREAEIHASDKSAAALAVAQSNGQRLGLSVHWHHGCWWDGISDREFDLVLSNPPYIAQGDPHLRALHHEPADALTAGPSGLDDLQAIISTTRNRLRPGGWLLLEHGYDQAASVSALIREAGFLKVQTRCDLSTTPRCTGGQNPYTGE